MFDKVLNTPRYCLSYPMLDLDLDYFEATSIENFHLSTFSSRSELA